MHKTQPFFFAVFFATLAADFFSRTLRPCSVMCDGSTRLPLWDVLVVDRVFRPLALVVLLRWPFDLLELPI